MNDNERIKKLSSLIDRGGVVFFGGAGVSTESGIPDFRSENGLYSRKYDHPPEEMLSHGFFFSHTREFFEFYGKAILCCLDVGPNPAHRLCAKWEKEGLLDAVVTQNIDGLHTAAGSKNVFELHGSVMRNRCIECGRKYPAEYIRKSEGIPRCACGGIIKPDVVLYGEPLDGETVNGAARAIAAAKTLIVAGTSLSVYPAAGMIDIFGGDALVLINRQSLAAEARADLTIHGSVGEVLSAAEKLRQ